jgi:hypothetical protein
MNVRYEQAALSIQALLPEGPRLVVIGSTSFWHGESEPTCTQIGQLLATIPELVLLTGGVEGVGETVGRSFFQKRCVSGEEPRVYHVLPEGEPGWDYGETFFAGSDMTERREVLGRLSDLYLAVEGGPGTEHEAAVASVRKAIIIPVGRSGGHAGELYSRMTPPPALDEQTWTILGSIKSTPEETARAVLRAVQSCLSSRGQS